MVQFELCKPKQNKQSLPKILVFAVEPTKGSFAHRLVAESLPGTAAPCPAGATESQRPSSRERADSSKALAGAPGRAHVSQLPLDYAPASPRRRVTGGAGAAGYLQAHRILGPGEEGTSGEGGHLAGLGADRNLLSHWGLGFFRLRLHLPVPKEPIFPLHVTCRRPREGSPAAPAPHSKYSSPPPNDPGTLRQPAPAAAPRAWASRPFPFSLMGDI